jgi:hypothetical protein
MHACGVERSTLGLGPGGKYKSVYPARLPLACPLYAPAAPLPLACEAPLACCLHPV